MSDSQAGAEPETVMIDTTGPENYTPGDLRTNTEVPEKNPF